MGRKSSYELVGDIAGALSWSPKSVKEIAEEVGSNRNSVVSYLEEMVKLPNVREFETEDGRERRFGFSRLMVAGHQSGNSEESSSMEKYRFCPCGKPVEYPAVRCKKHRDRNFGKAESRIARLCPDYEGVYKGEVKLGVRRKNGRLEVFDE